MAVRPPGQGTRRPGLTGRVWTVDAMHARAFQPAYLSLDRAALRARVQRALDELADCRACPRDCGVNRLEDRWSACKTGRYAVVGTAFPHFGEEDCLRGWRGSGTIFFSHCNLRCVFCQNYDISQAVKPGPAARGSTPDEIADMMLALQRRGCHNINFVTPEHVAPQIVEALPFAVDMGLRVPLVYNTSAFDSLDSLRVLDGLVDVYMPDFKLWYEAPSRKYLAARNYPSVAREVIAEMHRQVGELTVDENGLALRGVLVRHLVMPGLLDDTRQIVAWLAKLSPDTYVNLMDQYYPAGKVPDAPRYAAINRRLTDAEMTEANAAARAAGLWRLDERWRAMSARRELELVIG